MVLGPLKNLSEKWRFRKLIVHNPNSTLVRLSPDELRSVGKLVAENLKGTFLCCQAVIPEMVKQGGGAIVNVSALAGHWRASLAGVQYTAGKAGVEGLTRQLAYDWGRSGIRVNAVAPTVTLTGDRVRSLWEAKSEEEKKKVLSDIPLGRLGTPEEVASVVVFLASNESSYITGITIDVSGGRYLR